jgi:uncharacterized protein YegL
MQLRFWEIVLLALALVSAIFLLVAWTIGAQVVVREAAFTRTVRPAIAFWGEPVGVELHIDADVLPVCATSVPTTPLAVALVIDRSGSMGSTDDSPMEAAKKAASDFTDLLNLAEEGDTIAVVTFDDEANLETDFSFDRDHIVRTIQAIESGGGTSIAEGLSLATGLFSGSQLPEGRRDMLIVLSDGKDDPPDAAIAAAEVARFRGIRVVTIAMGDEADKETLSQIASSPDDAKTGSAADLLDIYSTIARDVVGVVATDVTLTERINDEDFALTSLLYRAEQKGNQITWQLPFVGQRGRSMVYDLRPRSLGYHTVSPDPGQMTLVDCHDQPVAQTTPSGPSVLVVFPLWVFLLAPALAGVWALFRIIKALIPPPRRPTPPPPSRTPPPTRNEPERPPLPPGAIHGWVTEHIPCSSGRPLSIRKRQPEQIQKEIQKLQPGEQIPVAISIVQVQDASQEVGRVDVTFRLSKEYRYETGTDEYILWMQMDRFFVSPAHQDYINARGPMLDHAELLARQVEWKRSPQPKSPVCVRKIIGQLHSTDDIHFFEQRGYHHSQDGTQVEKVFEA